MMVQWEKQCALFRLPGESQIAPVLRRDSRTREARSSPSATSPSYNSAKVAGCKYTRPAVPPLMSLLGSLAMEFESFAVVIWKCSRKHIWESDFIRVSPQNAFGIPSHERYVNHITITRSVVERIQFCFNRKSMNPGSSFNRRFRY